MPDITQRIAEILLEHSMLECSWGSEPNCCNCGYDAKDEPPKPLVVGWEWAKEEDGWVKHVAEVLTTELGLTREERSVWDRSQAFSTGYESRYVTKWVLDVS